MKTDTSQHPSRSLSTVEYARRMLIAEKLVKLGCKWPIIHEMLAIRIADAQRLIFEVHNDRHLLSRLEKGMYWFRAAGKYNIRMTHATFMYHIYKAYDNSSPGLLEAEKILLTYTQYLNLVKAPVIDNINRAFYLLDSLSKGKGFEVRSCPECQSRFVAIGAIYVEKCTACERNQYLNCEICGASMENPYAPGNNGSRKTKCGGCSVKLRKERRRLQARRKYICSASAYYY